jgi:RNA polymerase sigma-70 factor, ECF subfamily
MAPGFCNLFLTLSHPGLSVNKKRSISIKTLETPEKWVDLYGNYLYRYAFFRVYESVVAEDLVQETFLAALGSIKNFQRRSSVKTWLTGILKHKIIDHFRKKAKEQILDDIDPNINELENFFDQRGHWKIKLTKWNSDPQRLYDQKEFLEVFHKCLSELPGRQKSAFVLREIIGENTNEICKNLDVSTTNCWVLLHRARMYLRQCLETKWFASVDGKESI